MRRGLLVVCLLFVALTSGCGRFDGLAFREDTRLDIVAPDDRADVALPVTVRWTAARGAAAYGVFVDRAPQPPGKTLAWFARDDDNCFAADGCPDTAYFAQRQIFRTTATSFEITQLLDTQRDTRRREFHEATIVLLDDAGRRIGESAWSVEFQVDRDQPE